MGDDNKQTLSQSLNDRGKEYRETEAQYALLCDQDWDEMSVEEQMMAFFSVCKRIHKGDVVDGGSYRYVLYDVFGFDMESYGMGMQCGYMAIHNSIVDQEELETLRKENNEMKKQLDLCKDDLK